jgi:hypothetical protein
MTGGRGKRWATVASSLDWTPGCVIVDLAASRASARCECLCDRVTGVNRRGSVEPPRELFLGLRGEHPAPSRGDAGGERGLGTRFLAVLLNHAGADDGADINHDPLYCGLQRGSAIRRERCYLHPFHTTYSLTSHIRS